MDRGKILWEEDLEKLGGQWARYLDVDGDGIPYRTVPGNCHPRSAYFTRGTGHTEQATYSEAPEVWERVLNRIKKKSETARTLVPRPVIETTSGARVGMIGFGSTDPAIQEARYRLAQRGIKTDYMRIRSYPFKPEVHDFIRNHSRNYVVELNRDGQMQQLLALDIPAYATSLISLAHVDGLPLTACWVEDALQAREEQS
jgi:2-oxoglutarate ferredoxin oxidoreductase subunit alpha